MSACLKLATTSKFKPGGEEALQKLGAALFKELVKEVEQPREEVEEDLCLENSSIKSRGLPTDLLETSTGNVESHKWSQEKEELTAEISSLRQQLEALESTKLIQSADPALDEASQRELELEEENQHLKKEIENLNSGMAYAKSQFHKLKAVKDEKVTEVVDLNQKVDELNKLCSELESSNFESTSQLDTLKLEMQQLQDTNTNLLEALDEGRDKESALQETLREMEFELGAARKNLNESESLTDELRSLREQVQVKDEDLAFLREQLDSKDAQVNTLRIESEAKDVDLNDFAERLANKDADISFINDQVQEKETHLMQLKGDLEALTQQRATAESRVEELQVENSTLATDKESLMNKMRHAKQQFEKLKKVNEDRGKQIAELKVTEAQLEEALIQIDALKTQVEREVDSNTSQELYNHIATLESEMQNIQEQLESANTERLELQTQLTNAAAQVSEADSQTEFLRSQLEGSLASLQKLEDELNARNSQLQESSSQVVGLQEDLQRLMQEREGAVQLQTHFDEATTTIEELNQALFEKNSAVQMQSEQIVALERRLEELSIVESQLRDAHSEVERAAANVQHLQTCVAERDDELAIRSKEVTNLNAELIQLPEIQQAANRMQEQLDDIIPKYHAMEQEISSRDGRIQELESRAVFVDELQRELGTRDELISSHSEEIAKLEAEKQQVSLELEDAGRRLGEMEGEMNEAFEIAELADSESQKANAACAEMEEQLRVAHQNVAELEGQMSNLQADVSSAHAELDSARRTLESQAKTEVELQSMKVRLEVADGELQRLRQELVELESAKENLTVVEGSLRTAEAVATSLRQQLEASQERVKELSSNKDQMEDVATQVQAARNESDDLRRQLAESEALVASVRGEQEQASASIARDSAAHQDLQTEYHRLQQELHDAQSDLSTARNHATASGEEVNNLRQKVMQLETAFAVSGTGSQSAFTSFGTPQTHMGSPASTATPVQGAAASGIDPSFQMKLDSISKQLADARLQESVLMGDLEAVRTELENERKLRSDAQAMLEQTAVRTTSGAASALQISMDGGTNKKDEDIYDVEAAVLSGGDASGFQPISGLIKGLPFMKYLKPLITAAEAIDKGFIVLMRQPALRFMLLTYFVLLHIVAYLIGKA